MAPDVQPADNSAHDPVAEPANPAIHPVVADVTARVTDRSRASRTAYLQRISRAASELSLRPARTDLGCSNLAHAVAACGGSDRTTMAADTGRQPRDHHVLQRHALGARPVRALPAAMKQTAREVGAVARVAGGVPAMCDGITQGRAGMELSLFSRDVIAMSAAIAPVARRVRRGPHARGLRQDRAGSRGGRVVVRPPADGAGACRADGFRAVQRRQGGDAQGVSPRATSVARSCSRARSRPTTRRAPAPSTAPPTPTRCSWTSWGCTCPGRRSSTPTTRCAMR